MTNFGFHQQNTTLTEVETLANSWSPQRVKYTLRSQPGAAQQSKGPPNSQRRDIDCRGFSKMQAVKGSGCPRRCTAEPKDEAQRGEDDRSSWIFCREGRPSPSGVSEAPDGKTHRPLLPRQSVDPETPAGEALQGGKSWRREQCRDTLWSCCRPLLFSFSSSSHTPLLLLLLLLLWR